MSKNMIVIPPHIKRTWTKTLQKKLTQIWRYHMNGDQALGEFFASGKFWMSVIMDHPPDIVHIFNVWFNDDKWWVWTLKLALYPWVFMSKMIDIWFIKYACNSAAVASMGLEDSYAMAQVFGLVLFAPMIITLYRLLGRGIKWFSEVGEE